MTPDLDSLDNARPHRIQRKRTKGWRMPKGAVYVGRPTPWGNLWRAGEPIYEMLSADYGPDTPAWFGRKAGEIVRDAAEAVELYRLWIADCEKRGVPFCLPALRGKNLACWCPLDQPCHADVLLELANK